MTALAPAEILAANTTLKNRPDRPASYVFSGVSGDARHSFGYHVDPDELPAADYSVVTKRDRQGARVNPRSASAWDLSFHQRDMTLVTNRLLQAAKSRDPRMVGVREFCGTRNGRDTYPWDLHTNSCEGINSWDDSHLWHVHISFYRDATAKQIQAVVSVICGKNMNLPQRFKAVGSKAKRAVAKPTFVLPPGHYYGLITGPSDSHGGYFATERPAVRLIQQRLQKLGHAPNTPSWADGKFERPTAVAVQRWQQAKHRPVTGRVTADDWKALF
ncbi:peptidoglycan-binding protein [uncultured Jatrophihabitans sp.]|uniref:peptidoglycan-binding domain-containing protein n=1 Tax=uncultured Jatrophihabitans sp. TaxID=1610747 RepID=UPI0035CBF4BA